MWVLFHRWWRKVKRSYIKAKGGKFVQRSALHWSLNLSLNNRRSNSQGFNQQPDESQDISWI